MQAVEFSLTAGAIEQCTEFISSAALRKACPDAETMRYLEAMQALFSAYKGSFSAVETRYGFNDDTKVVFYDIKCSAHFEDPVVERIYKEWPTNPKLGGKFGPVCPLRRGMCVGLVNGAHMLLCIGNSKFYYGTERDILQHVGDVVLSEKANGEYTMLASTPNRDGKEPQWLVFGSKNVRLALPYWQEKPKETLRVLDSVMQSYIPTPVAAAVSAASNRFAFLLEMIPLWLDLLDPGLLPVLTAEGGGVTILGEQVGVHAHIADVYDNAHIRLFAVLPHNKLATTVGCDLRQAQRQLCHDTLQMVHMITFSLPEQYEACQQALHEIASGPIDVQGEGAVVYMYGGGQLGGHLQRVFKFKCQEYAFDRRLRTLLTRVAGELARGVVDPARLRAESMRIAAQLERAFANDFSQMNAQRARSRIELVPAILAFLERHQRTIYCTEFSDNFVSMLTTCEARKSEYVNLANELFLGGGSSTIKEVDTLQLEWDALLQKYDSVEVQLKPAEQLAEQIVQEWKKRAAGEFRLIGIAASPAGGKTRVLTHVAQLLREEELEDCVLCDRDAFCIEDGGMSTGDVIHRRWITTIKENLTKGRIVLVGNTFAGTFATKFEKEVGASMLLFAWQEHTKYDNLFHLECLRRLSKRVDDYSDGSTLTLGLGSKVVLNKYFSSAPNAGMLTGRLKQGTVVIISVLTTQAKPPQHFLQDLDRLRKHAVEPMASAPAPAAVTAKKPNLPRRYTKSPLPPPSDSKNKLVFIAISPNNDTFRRYLDLADTTLLRTDCHLTLYYHPTAQQISAALQQQKCGLPVFYGAAMVTVALDVQRTKQLQFVAMQPPKELSVRDSLAHVTLGTTDYDLLPPSTSGKCLSLLQPLEIPPAEQQPIKLENKWFVWIKALDPPSVPFQGDILFYIA